MKQWSFKNVLCLIASNYILLIDWSWRKLISRSFGNLLCLILFLHPSRSKYPAIIATNCLLKMLACLRSCMSWMVYTFTAGIFYILPEQISWLEMQLDLPACKSSSKWAELVLGSIRNNLSWLAYIKHPPPPPQPNQKTSNKPTMFLAILLSDSPELLKLKGEEVSVTAEYPGTSEHS